MQNSLQLTLFTLEEVAARFRVSRRTLQAHIRKYPHYRTLGRRKLFTEADIARLYEALPCPSSSNLRVKARRRTTALEAPTSESMLTEARALVTERQPNAFAAAGSPKSNAPNTSTRAR
jgi:DNA-binding transcriptional MerR regulator